MIDASTFRASDLMAVPARPADPSETDGLDRATPEALTATGLADVFEREAPLLLATARAILLDDREAEDLVQATFEIAMRRVDQLRDPAAVRGWLLRIETREAFRLRRRLARVMRLDPTIVEVPARPIDQVDRLAVRAALARLPARQRAAVVLHHLVGLPVQETADALGTSTNTVKSQLRVALARLREELADG